MPVEGRSRGMFWMGARKTPMWIRRPDGASEGHRSSRSTVAELGPHANTIGQVCADSPAQSHLGAGAPTHEPPFSHWGREFPASPQITVASPLRPARSRAEGEFPPVPADTKLGRIACMPPTPRLQLSVENVDVFLMRG